MGITDLLKKPAEPEQDKVTPDVKRPVEKPDVKPAEKSTKLSKVKSEQQIRPVGETITVEAYRRLQLIEGTPSDLEGLMEKEKTLAQGEVKKEHNYIGIGIMFIIIVFGVMFGLMMLSKIDLGGILAMMV